MKQKNPRRLCLNDRHDKVCKKASLTPSNVKVYRKVVSVTDVDIDRMRQRGLHAKNIFNPDERRLQASLRKDTPVVKRLVAYLSKLGVMNNRSLGSVVVLVSKPECKQQDWHTDYSPKSLHGVKTKPVGVILALEDETFFEEYPDKRHQLQRGDVLMFEGDVVHAGSAYASDNVRIHAYLDSDEVRRERNRTYLLEDRKPLLPGQNQERAYRTRGARPKRHYAYCP